MTFHDIFKASFLENVTQFSAVDTLIGMLFALVIGLFIFVVYKKTFNGVMYSGGFALTLVGLFFGDNPGDYGGDVQCGALPRYGGCAFHCSLSGGDQGAD